ncbi:MULTISPECIES: GNAT family N-acetyltransferase [unclassified Streptomyces]|uniref:GNAT family N-acetyltransferase n=1 Tax=unclassified Streptomyces TaxID=2593676 RepID=UPI0037009187
MTPHGQLTVRRPADVPPDSLVRLMRTYEKNLTGAATYTREDALRAAGPPGYEENSWCLTGPGDEVIAWAALTPRGDELDAVLTALPGRHGVSAARTLLCLLLDRADALALEDGRPYSVTVGGVLRGDEVVPVVLKEAGFVRGATTGQYDIDLTADALPMVLPDGGAVRAADLDDPGELAALHALHRRCSSKGPKTGDAAVYAAALRRSRDDGGAALLLEVSGRPAGHVLTHGAGHEGRVLEVAVAPAFRGLGIGLALLTAGFAELRARGAVRALATLETGDVHRAEAFVPVFAVTGARSLTRFRLGPA